jgi:branched-chain amino acid aminotransferase
LTIPISAEQMIADVNATLQKNSLTDAYVRLIVTRGGTTLGLDPYKGCTPTIIIIADKITLYPDELYENGLEIITASTVQTNPAALNPRVKSLNYLKNIMAKIEGLQAGCQEAMMLNQAGNVAECTGDNIFTIKKNVIRTPSVESGILEGITRNAVIKLARKKGYEVHEVTMNRHDVYVADECFLTGSAAEVIPVIKVDSRPIGDGKVGPITKELIADFRKFVVQPPA